MVFNQKGAIMKQFLGNKTILEAELNDPDLFSGWESSLHPVEIDGGLKIYDLCEFMEGLDV